MSHSGTPKSGKMSSPRLDSSSSILDAHATNSKQLLNAYIYDFLIKSRLPQTARIFVNEADVPTSQNSSSSSNSPGDGQAPHIQFQKDNNLPQLSMAMDAPQGFLFEWWLVFWDVFQAKNNRGSSQMAMQYYQLQMMKQRQQQELAGMNGHPNMYGVGGQAQAQTQAQAQAQAQGQPQGQPQQLDPQQQQRMMMQMMMKQQNMPVMLDQQLQMLGPQLQQQMFLQKQQQQQQQQGLLPGQQQLAQHSQPGQYPQMPGSQSQFQPQPQNRIQQHAQTQMNNLRHQAAVAAQQQYQPGEAGSPATMNRLSQGTPQVPHGQQPMNAILPFQQHMAQPVNSQPGPKTNGAHPNGAQGPPMPNGTAGGEMLNGATSAGPNRNINALQDYQMQLMLLEKQNKKRLDIARNNGTTDFSLVSMSNNVNNMNMLPPNTGNSGPQQKPSPGISGGSGSPSITKAPSPGSNGAKKKKERPVKRGRKPSTSGASQDAALGPNLSTNLKKEYTTPLTPSSEAPNEPATKKKKKAADSPKKQPAASTNAKGDKKDKESGTFNGSQQPNFEGGSNDQMFPILGGSSNNDNQMFGAGSNGGGLDDIDFDFNLFLDGGADANMHDGIGGFNWGNVDAIEGSEL